MLGVLGSSSARFSLLASAIENVQRQYDKYEINETYDEKASKGTISSVTLVKLDHSKRLGPHEYRPSLMDINPARDLAIRP